MLSVVETSPHVPKAINQPADGDIHGGRTQDPPLH